jgi:hypothetical protein
MAKLEIGDEILNKLDRAVFLRWADDQDDPDRAVAIADERTRANR